MLKRRIALSAAVAAIVVGSSQPVYADPDPTSPAAIWARQHCVGNQWEYQGFASFHDCVDFYYLIYPNEPIDP